MTLVNKEANIIKRAEAENASPTP
jgi:hypothetical protein